MGYKSLWYDEAIAVTSIECSSCSLFTPEYYKPVFSLMLRVWSLFFGKNEFTIRFFSTIFGVAAIYLVFLIAKEMFDKGVALLSATIFSFSFAHIYISRQVGHYALFIFLILFSALIFMKIIKGTQQKYLILLAIINILSLFTHISAIFMIMAQNIFFIIYIVGQKSAKKVLKNWLLSQALIFITIILLFIKSTPAVIETVEMPEYRIYAKHTFPAVIKTFEAFSYGARQAGHLWVGYSFSRHTTFPYSLLLFIYTFFSILGFIYGLLTNESEKSLFISYLLLWLVLPIGFTYCFSKIFFPIYEIKHQVISSVPFYIAVAYGVTKVKKYFLRLCIVILIMALSIGALGNLYSMEKMESWREIVSFIQSKIGRGDLLFFEPINQIVPFWYYYKYGQKNTGISRGGKIINNELENYFIEDGIRFSGTKLGEIDELSKNKSYYDKVIHNHGKIFLILSPYWPTGNTKEEVLRYFESRKLMEKKQYLYDGIEVCIFK